MNFIKTTKRKIFILPFLGLIIFLSILSFYSFWQKISSGELALTNIPAPINQDIEVKPIIINPIASGVVPHHLAARPIIDNFFQVIAKQGQIDTVVIFSPDHFNRGLNTARSAFLTVTKKQDFMAMPTDQLLIDQLATDNNFTFNDSNILLEHGIINLLPEIKKYLPTTKILPILIPQNITGQEVADLVDDLAEVNEKILLVASVDCSHYLPINAALFHDGKSLRTLINYEEKEFTNLEVDCWQCLYGARKYANLQAAEDYQLLAHQNSGDFIKNNNQEETTTYLSLIFKDGTMPKEKKITDQTILFVGDMMLDRGVEELMKKKSIYYPFEQINRFFQGIDLVVANLEGPIVENPPYTGANSLQFAFMPEIMKALNFSHVNLVSLANNHTTNMGAAGLAQTRQHLAEAKINFFGDPTKCSQEFIYNQDNLSFLAFNRTFSNCQDADIVKVISQVKQANPANFIIVAIHWGVEYKTVNSAGQEKLAQKMIDNGADLIIGHHPHVVENVGIYKNKLIFYSLGNFIFDQYFSQNTQQGLAVGLEIKNDKLLFRLFPLNLHFSQPHLMSDQETAQFLQVLAKNSSQELQSQINNGIIEVIK